MMIDAESAAYRNVSAVSAEMADGTKPLKRFLVRDLCHDAPSHANRIGLGTARLAGTHR
jgi:hypothetical protein